MGRSAEAAVVLDRLRTNERLAALMSHAQLLQRWGRWAEARDLATNAVATWEPGRQPFVLGPIEARLVRTLGLAGAFIERARAAPDPLVQAIGLGALVPGFSPLAGGLH